MKYFWLKCKPKKIFNNFSLRSKEIGLLEIKFEFFEFELRHKIENCDKRAYLCRLISYKLYAYIKDETN